jgi:SAM-dependent methyltransferase
MDAAAGEAAGPAADAPKSATWPDPMLARSFGPEAGRYDQVRPSYPAAALDLVIGQLATEDGNCACVVDLGAGTGKLTDSLLNRNVEVVAVEPDPQMLAVLAARLPQVRALAGSAEQIPLPDGSVDAVLVGQAFHWFRRPDADRELARVLRSGGVAGMIWNLPDRSVEWIPKLYQAARQRERLFQQPFEPLEEEFFTPPEQASVPSEHHLEGPGGLHDLVHTWSWVITLDKPEQDALDRRLRILISQYAELQGPVVVMPHLTEVIWQYRR